MKIATLFTSFRNRLTKISEKEPLSRFSLLLVILFDIFLFSLIASGLSDVTKNITTPSEYAGYSCLSLLDTDKIVDDQTRKLTIIRAIDNYHSYKYNESSSYTTEYSYRYYEGNYGKWCEAIRSTVANVYNTAGNPFSFSTKIRELENLEKLISANQIEQQNARSIYDTKLLEKGVNQTETLDPGTATDLARKVQNLRASSGALAAQKSQIVDEIYALPEVQNVVLSMTSNAAIIRSTYASLVFWYPVKTFGMQLLFLIPLFLVVAFWVKRSTAKGKEIQSLVGSHVVGVIAVFGLLKVMEFVYDILPKKLIENVIAFFEYWNIIQIWYYVLVLAAIAACLFAIYIVQKKILSVRRQEMKRVASGQCSRCSARRIDHEEFCVSCGTPVFTKCPVCAGKTFLGGEYCTKCGANMNKE